MRLEVPYATIMMSAFSVLYFSNLTSFFLMRLNFFCNFLLTSSSSPSFKNKDLIMFGFLPLHPVKAHLFVPRPTSHVLRTLVTSTGSIICPNTPSPKIMTGFLYLSAMSNAIRVKSNISWHEAGANTTRL